MIKAISWLLVSLVWIALGCTSPVPTQISQETIPATLTRAITQTRVTVTSPPTGIADKKVTPHDLVRPVMSEPRSDIPKYNRKDWRHWSDADGDCQNTRHEVLIHESKSPVTYKSDRQCQVVEGKWLDPYTGEEVRLASRLDVDHMIPLKNAHLSGAWSWDQKKRKAFANNMNDPAHLIAVTASANRQKGARGPEQWKPSNKGYWCKYARDWTRIKVDWGLTVTSNEWRAIETMLGTCGSGITYSPANTVAPSERAALSQPPTKSPPVKVASNKSVKITSISCQSKPELVRIQNTGSVDLELTGWRIEDEGRKATMKFPSGFGLTAGSSVDVLAGAKGRNTAAVLYWSARNVLNNDGDTAYLFNAQNELVSQKACQ